MRGFFDGEYQDGELRGCTFIAGQRGMGKTTEMARLLAACGGGCLFFDSLSKHEAILRGFRLISQPADLDAYMRVNRGRRFRILYQPRSGGVDDHFRAVCTAVRAFGWMVLGVDELDMMCGARWGDRRMCPEFYHLVNYGRHERVSMLATARRAQNVARGFTSQCGEMRLFHMREKADIVYFQEFIGSDALRLPSLSKFQFLHWNGAGEAALKTGQKPI